MLEKLLRSKPKEYGNYNDLEILQYLIKNSCIKCIVYGTGDMGRWLIDWLKRAYHIVPDFIIDSVPQIEQLDGIKVINLEQFKEKNKEKYFVIVADEKYKDLEYRQKLSNFLMQNGAVTIFNSHRVVGPYWPSWYLFIKDHIQDFELLYNDLCDDVSRDTMLHYLETYLTGARYEGITFPEKYKYWGKDNQQYSLFELKDNEVILDLGGGCGDTIFQYLKGDFPFQKIISVEADEKSLYYIKRSIGLLKKAVQSKIQVDHYYIGIGDNTIDKLYCKEDISLIKMDIEGAEMEALESGINVIRKNRPVLAISAYHKQDDLLKIPRFLRENFIKYIFALRKYPSVYFSEFPGIQQINELVLYAIPEERYNYYGIQYN